MDDIQTTEVAGERLTLLGERLIWWPARRTLLAADVHVGKIASLRQQGAPVPAGELDAILERLRREIARRRPDRLVVLGDFIHDRRGLTDGVVGSVGEALAGFDLEILVVGGNHERTHGPLPSDWPVDFAEPPVVDGPFVLRHEPAPHPDGYVLAGHLHPTVLLEEAGDRLRLPCFAFGDEVGVLPAFHPMTNGVEVDRREHRVFVVADSDVVDI
jgi:DNA ligase-associated metallophosphoesterase